MFTNLKFYRNENLTSNQRAQLARLPPIFIFLFEIQLLICKECHQAIAITIVLEHLKKHFQPAEFEKNNWKSAIQALPLTAFQYSYGLIKNRQPVSIINELHPPKNGFKCDFSGCFQLFLSKDKYYRHLSSSHQISTSNEQKKHVEICYIQSLTKTSYFFEVSQFGRLALPPRSTTDSPADSPLDPRSDTIPSLGGSSVNSLIAQFLTKHQKTREELEKPKVFYQFNTTDEFSSFLKESKYPRFLHNRDLDKLTPLLELPGEIEAVLKPALEYLLRMANCKIAYTPRPALYALNSFSNDSTTMKGFKSLQNTASLQKYLRVFYAFFAFLLNTVDYITDSNPPKSFRNLYRLEPELQAKLQSLKATLEQQQGAETSENPNDPELNLSESDLEDESESDSNESDFEGFDNSSRDSPLGSLDEEIEEFQRSFFESIQIPRLRIRNLTRDVLNFYISLIRIKIANPFIHPISSFFAIYSITPKKSSFRHISVISQYYSAFIYCSQLLVLEWDFNKHYLESLDPQITEDLTSFMHDYFHNQSATSLAEILALRAYIFKILPEISKNEPNIDQINNSTLRYREIVVSIDNFRDFFRHSILHATKLLRQDLCLEPRFFVEIASQIDLEKAAKTESLFESELGFNCLSKNPHFTPLATYFQNKTLDPNSTLFSHWYSIQEDEIQLKTAPGKAYLDRVRSFLKVLLLLVHVSGGGPARGSETASILHANTMKNTRTLVLHRDLGLFIVRLRYSKTAALTCQERQAIRALPKSVSFLILFYLAVILPFIQFIELELYGEITRSKELLFYSYPKTLTSDDLARTFRLLSLGSIGQKISISAYRQLIQGFIRYFIDLDSDLISSKTDYSIENLTALQMHHSKQTATLVYGRHNFIFPHIPADIQQAMLQLSLKFHDFFHISPEFFIFDPAGTFQEASIGSKKPIRVSKPEPLPALKFTKKHRRSLSSEEPVKKVKASELANYLTFEPKSLRSLDLGLDAQTPLPLEGELDRAQYMRSSSLEFASFDSEKVSIFPSDDILVRLLQDFFQDSTVQFRSPEQREAFYYILKRTPCLTVILPTAGGKTTLFLLAASLISSKTTIVLVPLVALKASLANRASDFNISHAIFEEQYENTPDSSLVLVSVESVQNLQFIEYCQSLRARNQLDCIIFDEAHLIPLASGYRPVMHQLKQLRILPVPFYFFSATLSAQNLIRMETEMLISQNHVIRANINQPHIEYSVRFFLNLRGGVKTHFAELFQFLVDFQTEQGTQTNEIASGGSILIYFPIKTQVDQFQSTYPNVVTRFHADLSPEEKDQNLKAFETGRFSILAATSAIGAGYDFTNIRLVVHFYFAYEFTNFIQETGRACRQPGTRGYSIIYTTPRELVLDPRDSEERQLMKRYMAQTKCRRQLIQSAFNELEVSSCSSGEIPCDLCQKQQEALDQGPRELQVRGFSLIFRFPISILIF